MRTVERRVCQVNRRHVDGTWEFEFSGVHDYLLRLSMCFQVTLTTLSENLINLAG